MSNTSENIDAQTVKNSISGRIHSVETFGALDGPGIRYVVFIQGCPLRCVYCHNPDSWCEQDGELRTAGEVVEDILRYRSFIKTGGVTLSGGEPLMQPDFCLEIIRRCHEKEMHVAIDTSGGILLEACKPVIEEADLLLLDIKSLDEKLCIAITGKTGKNALQILRYREAMNKPVWIRHVIVPGLTLKPELLEALADFLTAYQCVERVEILPFHKMGEYKWKELGRRYSLADVAEPSPEEVEAARDIFRKRGLPIAVDQK